MDLYSARIWPSARIVADVEYEVLIERIAEFTLRGAFSRITDEQNWEHEELRLKGLAALELFHNARAVWTDPIGFEEALAEAYDGTFHEANELDVDLLERIDRDLQSRWRRAGYPVLTLATDMKKLFARLETAAGDCSRNARERLLDELLQAAANP